MLRNNLSRNLSLLILLACCLAERTHFTAAFAPSSIAGSHALSKSITTSCSTLSGSSSDDSNSDSSVRASTATIPEEKEGVIVVNGSTEKEDLLLKLANEETNTQTKLSPEQVKLYNNAIDSLPPPPESLDVNGNWRLVATISPEAEAGDNVDFFDPQSWKNYIEGTGPSPFQSLITGSSRVNGLSQWLTDRNFDNIVKFQVGPIDGTLVLKANLEGVDNNKRTFRFQNGFFLFKTVWGGSITLPYPVPFWLLGDRAVGWLNTIGYDTQTGIRAAVGNKGTRFVFQQLNGQDAVLSDDIMTASKLYDTSSDNKEDTQHETDEEEKRNNAGLTKRAVIICPQQFGGKPGDYNPLIRELRERGHPVYIARISALQWLSITKSLPTEAYFKGELEPSKTLTFYMDAINAAVQRLDEGKSEDEGAEFTILSHSIGGWVARAWLGEVASESVRKRCKKYVSLGTPHLAPPEDSIVAKVDQTRGLLKYINDRWPGAYFSPDIEYTCIASNAVQGKLALDLDSILGFSSYLALCGDGNVEGDGITPIQAAILEGATPMVLEDVYHADILPNPVGGKNTKLIGCQWYADKLDEWEGAL